ncbi:unnamed protein product [Chondrus crispus]|uniref:Uncharacterized protein n=1 Tax=Chondrus crispus TaxID=2769 RepID=R7QQF9_CHOCR|nr:unnamed protein product [Chondrus crispus]CDF40737.1 unnamed protein product [Chondrus crispus]|eukprot:XP_005711031.1 unnamed protein product [Chondrus crispus]
MHTAKPPLSRPTTIFVHSIFRGNLEEQNTRGLFLIPGIDINAIAKGDNLATFFSEGVLAHFE